MPVGPLLMKKLPLWATCGIGGSISIFGVLLSSLVKKYVAFLCFYPTFFGFGIGIGYMAPIIAGWEHFPDRKGMVSGLTILGFGFGSFIFGFVSLAIANPNNEEADLDTEGGSIFSPNRPEADKAPVMLQVNCAIWFCLMMIALPFLKRRKQIQPASQDAVNEQPEVEGEQQEVQVEQQREEQVAPAPIKIDPTFKEILRDIRTYQIWGLIICSSLYPLYIASNFKSYGETGIDDDQFITIVGAVGAVFNGLSRGIWSTIQDKVGFKWVYFILLCVQV